MGKKDKGPSPGGVKVSRRDFLNGLVITTLTAKPLAETAVDIALNHAINARVPIPASLQQTTRVPAGSTRVVIGIGNSNMRGEGADDVSIVQRVADETTEANIIPISEAVNGSLTTDVPGQYAKAKKRVPPGTKKKDTEVHAWTGENDIKDDPEIVAALERLSRNPLDVGSWRRYFQRRSQIRPEVGERLRDSMGKITADGIHDVTLYGLSPVQDAKQIVEIDPQTGKGTITPVRGPSLLDKVRQAIVADFIRQGTHAVVDTATQMQQEEIHVTVTDPAGLVTEDDFARGDQHFGPAAATRVARKRARLYRKTNTIDK